MGSNSGILGIVYEMKKKCTLIDQELMERLNLSQSELQFFNSLDNCTGISSPKLAKSMGLSASRISRVVDKLVVNGYLDRNIDATDRRAITLCLTDAGKSIKNEIDKGRVECESRLLRVIPESDIEKFRDIIAKIVKEM